MSFLDPYERNRRISLITWLRLGLAAVVLAIGLGLWWWLGG